MLKDKDMGVLYLRYDKNTSVGKVIELVKKERKSALNSEMINLIFLSEIIELMNYQDFCSDSLIQFYYESLRLFTGKLAQVEYRINNLTSLMIQKKNLANQPSLKQTKQVFSDGYSTTVKTDELSVLHQLKTEIVQKLCERLLVESK